MLNIIEKSSYFVATFDQDSPLAKNHNHCFELCELGPCFLKFMNTQCYTRASSVHFGTHIVHQVHFHSVQQTFTISNSLKKVIVIYRYSNKQDMRRTLLIRPRNKPQHCWKNEFQAFFCIMIRFSRTESDVHKLLLPYIYTHRHK